MNILTMTVFILILMAATAVGFLREWRQEQGFRHLTGTYFSTFWDKKNTAVKQRFRAKKQDRSPLDMSKGKLSIELIIEYRDILQPIAQELTREILYQKSSEYTENGLLAALWDEILKQYSSQNLQGAVKNLNDLTKLEIQDPVLRELFYRLFKASQDDFNELFSVKKHKINIYEAPSQLLQLFFSPELCSIMVRRREECHQQLTGCNSDEKKAIYNEYRDSLRSLLKQFPQTQVLSHLFDFSIPAGGENAPPT